MRILQLWMDEPTPSVLIALLGGLQITNIAHALSGVESCVRYYYPSNEIPNEAKSQDSSEEFQRVVL